MQANFRSVCDWPRLPGRSSIYGWLLPVLNREVCVGDFTVNCSWLTPVLGLGQLSKRPRTP